MLLKQFGAIRFNNWLASPTIPIWVAVLIGVLIGVILSTVIAGNTKRRVIVFTVALVVTAAVLEYFSAVKWFARPALGPGLILVFALLIGLAATTLIAGIKARPVLSSA